LLTNSTVFLSIEGITRHISVLRSKNRIPIIAVIIIIHKMSLRKEESYGVKEFYGADYYFRFIISPLIDRKVLQVQKHWLRQLSTLDVPVTRANKILLLIKLFFIL
jgi:hypothetical protein